MFQSGGGDELEEGTEEQVKEEEEADDDDDPVIVVGSDEVSQFTMYSKNLKSKKFKQKIKYWKCR